MLELKNLTFEVPLADGSKETKRIIDDLSLTIPDGRFTVITGPNGGGKSTLAKLIMGVERATSGQILLDGEDITDLSISERANKGIGYGFQQPARFKGMKVKKLLDIAAGKKLPMLACNEYLAKVGLCSASYLTREVDKNLSGGEVKRIEIATILARDPKLAIYDEPEAGIDLWRFDRLTERLSKPKAGEGGGTNLSRGLSTGIVLFCFGTLSILGPINSALYGDETFLLTNATLDFVTSMVLASSFGIGMAFAGVVLFCWQGSIFLLAQWLEPLMTANLMCEITIVGGFLILASGLSILKIEEISVMNLLPALLVPPVWFAILPLLPLR